MKTSFRCLVCLTILLITSFVAAAPARAQGDGDVEAKFIAMLKNATLATTASQMAAPVPGRRSGSKRIGMGPSNDGDRGPTQGRQARTRGKKVD